MNKLVDEYNNTYRSIEKKSINPDSSALTEEIGSRHKTPKFKVGNRVRNTKYKNIFSKGYTEIRKNIFACLFSVHNTISLSRHEQVCLIRLPFERYFSHHRAT